MTEVEQHLSLLRSKHKLDEAVMCGELSVDNDGSYILPTVNSIITFLTRDEELQKKLYFLWLPYHETLSFIDTLVLFAKGLTDYSIYYSSDISSKFSKFLWIYFEIPLGVEEFINEVLSNKRFDTTVDDRDKLLEWVVKYPYPTARKYINCELIRTYQNKR